MAVIYINNIIDINEVLNDIRVCRENRNDPESQITFDDDGFPVED